MDIDHLTELDPGPLTSSSLSSTQKQYRGVNQRSHVNGPPSLSCVWMKGKNVQISFHLPKTSGGLTCLIPFSPSMNLGLLLRTTVFQNLDDMRLSLRCQLACPHVATESGRKLTRIASIRSSLRNLGSMGILHLDAYDLSSATLSCDVRQKEGERVGRFSDTTLDLSARQTFVSSPWPPCHAQSIPRCTQHRPAHPKL